MPPKNGETKLATPCAISSWFGSWRGRSVRLSATRAHSSDSIAPSTAIVSVGNSSSLAEVQENGGSARSGSVCGMPPKRVPIVSTGSSSSATIAVIETSATTGPGMRAAARIVRPSRMRSGQRRRSSTAAATRTGRRSTSRPMANAYGLKVSRCCHSDCSCAKKSPGSLSMRSPSRSRSCEKAISTAMPLVKPMMIDTGTKRTSAPSLNSPSRNSTTPARAVEISRLVSP